MTPHKNQKSIGQGQNLFCLRKPLTVLFYFYRYSWKSARDQTPAAPFPPSRSPLTPPASLAKVATFAKGGLGALIRVCHSSVPPVVRSVAATPWLPAPPLRLLVAFKSLAGGVKGRNQNNILINFVNA